MTFLSDGSLYFFVSQGKFSRVGCYSVISQRDRIPYPHSSLTLHILQPWLELGQQPWEQQPQIQMQQPKGLDFRSKWKGIISFHRPSHDHLDLLMTEWVSNAPGGQRICRHPPGSKNTVCAVRDLGLIDAGWGVWGRRGDFRRVPQCSFMASPFVSSLN